MIVMIIQFYIFKPKIKLRKVKTKVNKILQLVETQPNPRLKILL